MLASRTAPRACCTSSRPRAVVAVRAAKGGFGRATTKKAVDTKGSGMVKKEINPRLAKELGINTPTLEAQRQEKEGAAFTRGSSEWKDGWRELGSVSEMFAAKPVKAVTVNNTDYAVFKHSTGYYCSDALSTAYKFPLIDAKVLDGSAGEPIAEVPLDGTQYNLSTGKVVVWCPGGGVVRGLLKGLKKDQAPINLKVFPTREADGKLYAQLYNKM